MPIFYESRLARIELPEDKKPELDAELDALTDEADDDQVEQRLKAKSIAWLEAGERITDPKNDPLGWLCQDDVRAALTHRLAGHPALLAQLDAHGRDAREMRLAS